MTESIAGYAQEAPGLLKAYEAVSVEDVHRPVWHLIPAPPARLLDIGAGTGRDAAHFAAMGHQVVAVEPVDELREGAKTLHPSPLIEWLKDGLPALAEVRARGEAFDAVLATAVWMHLDQAERIEAMPAVASLVRPGGVLILSLRHGPIPPGRRMFDVSAEETVALATREGLRCVVNTVTDSVQAGKPGVTWSRLAFKRVVPSEGSLRPRKDPSLRSG
ncbi:MAG TPA: class I SAM-dependent methyltransferase [Reyranella sp.]|nr:class I SAM-dependent methyltransferase [Reyranella sp.]